MSMLGKLRKAAVDKNYPGLTQEEGTQRIGDAARRSTEAWIKAEEPVEEPTVDVDPETIELEDKGPEISEAVRVQGRSKDTLTGLTEEEERQKAEAEWDAEQMATLAPHSWPEELEAADAADAAETEVEAEEAPPAGEEVYAQRMAAEVDPTQILAELQASTESGSEFRDIANNIISLGERKLFGSDPRGRISVQELKQALEVSNEPAVQAYIEAIEAYEEQARATPEGRDVSLPVILRPKSRGFLPTRAELGLQEASDWIINQWFPGMKSPTTTGLRDLRGSKLAKAQGQLRSSVDEAQQAMDATKKGSAEYKAARSAYWDAKAKLDQHIDDYGVVRESRQEAQPAPDPTPTATMHPVERKNEIRRLAEGVREGEIDNDAAKRHIESMEATPEEIELWNSIVTGPDPVTFSEWEKGVSKIADHQPHTFKETTEDVLTSVLEGKELHSEMAEYEDLAAKDAAELAAADITTLDRALERARGGFHWEELSEIYYTELFRRYEAGELSVDDVEKRLAHFGLEESS